MTEWLVDLGVEGKARANLLTSSTSLEDILCRICAKGNPPRPRREHGHNHGPFEGAHRALWTITPCDFEALDLLYNGKDGYRAAYCVGVHRGEVANETALNHFSSWLRDFEGRPVCESPEPMLGVGAKIWIPSDERINDALVTGRVLAREILVAAWLDAAESQIAVQTCDGPRFKAAAGVLAPKPTRLNIIGAWIRDGRVVDKSVKDRSMEIHNYGYT